MITFTAVIVAPTLTEVKVLISTRLYFTILLERIIFSQLQTKVVGAKKQRGDFS
jgi:hypothetical protein